MDKSGVAAAQFGGIRAVTRYQWLVFLVVWLGWTLDAADFGLYSLVLKPAMTELLGGNPPLADIGKYGGLLSMAGLLGWAFGGFLFGILADYIGRVRTLAFSIALYSVFTALQGLSQGIFDFAIYRFIAGLGTGAELMVGIPLLAETAKPRATRCRANLPIVSGRSGSGRCVEQSCHCGAVVDAKPDVIVHQMTSHGQHGAAG